MAWFATKLYETRYMAEKTLPSFYICRRKWGLEGYSKSSKIYHILGSIRTVLPQWSNNIWTTPILSPPPPKNLAPAAPSCGLVAMSETMPSIESTCSVLRRQATISSLNYSWLQVILCAFQTLKDLSLLQFVIMFTISIMLTIFRIDFNSTIWNIFNTLSKNYWFTKPFKLDVLLSIRNDQATVEEYNRPFQ